MKLLKNLKPARLLWILSVVGILVAGAAAGYFVRSCEANKEVEEYKEAIRVFETESTRVLTKVTESYVKVQKKVAAAIDNQRSLDKEAERRHQQTIDAINAKLDERFAAIQNWYEAALVRRQEEIRYELSDAADDPDAVRRLFLDIFGPGPGRTDP